MTILFERQNLRKVNLRILLWYGRQVEDLSAFRKMSMHGTVVG
jgi:hypothetical protein